MNIPLQDMIDSVVREAQEKVKTASSEEHQCSICGVAVGDGNGFCATHREVEKTASDISHDSGVDLEYAEKLAGAVEYITQHIGDLEDDKLVTEATDVSDLRGLLKESAGWSTWGRQGKKGKERQRGLLSSRGWTTGEAAGGTGAVGGALGALVGGTPRKESIKLTEEGLKHTKAYKGGGKRALLGAGIGAGLGALAGATQQKLWNPGGSDLDKKEKKSFDREALKTAILEKLGSGVDNPPKIANSASSGPEGAHASGEGPKPSGPGGHELVGSVDKAIAFTKKDAKSKVKSDLAAVLDHASSKDKKLQENLQNASKAGVKTAGVREALKVVVSNDPAAREKIAQKLSTSRSA